MDLGSPGTVACRATRQYHRSLAPTVAFCLPPCLVQFGWTFYSPKPPDEYEGELVDEQEDMRFRLLFVDPDDLSALRQAIVLAGDGEEDEDLVPEASEADECASDSME